MDARPAPPRSPKHRLYIDESGDHTFVQLDGPGRRYLGLLGVCFTIQNHYVAFAESMERLKRDFFGVNPDTPVVLHRTDLVNKKGPFRALLDPTVCARFDRALADLIEAAPFTMICVILDKERLRTNYSTPFHPYHYCLQAMLERYCRWLSERGTEGDVWAESRGSVEDRELERVYSAVRCQGTRFLKAATANRTLTSNSIKLRPKSANVLGLQLADILAHPVKQVALIERGLIPAPSKPCFGHELARIAYSKFRRGWQGVVDGYGRIWL